MACSGRAAAGWVAATLHITLLPASNLATIAPAATVLLQTLDPSRSRRGDTHEGIYYGRHVEEGSEEAKLPLHGPNQWPDEVGAQVVGKVPVS